MERSQIEQILDDVKGGKAQGDALDALTTQMNADDLARALRHVEKQASHVTTPNDIDAWTRVAADLLLAFSRNTSASFAAQAASFAADLFRTDLKDPDAAVAADLAAAFRGLDLPQLAAVLRDPETPLPEGARRRLAVAVSALEAPASVSEPAKIGSAAQVPTEFDRRLDALQAEQRQAEMITLIEEALATAPDDAHRAMLLPRMARLLASLGRTDEAERAWRRLRSVDPRNLEALRFYEDYHESRQDWTKLSSILQFALSANDAPEERLRINRKLARVAEDHLHNLDRAIDAHKRILAIAPQDLAAEEALLTLYEKTKKWAALVEHYNDRLRRLPSDDVEHRLETLFRLIEVYQSPERLPSEDQVLATYARIVEVSPTNREALMTLSQGYQTRERWSDLLRVLQRRVEATQDPGELLDLFHQIAEVAITRMSNETQAIPFLERILELDPANLDVVRTLKGIYERKRNQEKLFSMQVRELSMMDGRDRETHLLSAAHMAKERLFKYDEALRLFEEVHATNPDNEDAKANLHQIYVRMERWPAYAKFLEHEIARAPAHKRPDLMQRLGELLLERINDPAAARRQFEAILAVQPNNDPARRRLEGILLDAGDLDALSDRFAERGGAAAFVAMLAGREARETDVAKQVRLNLAMALACEQDLRDPNRALTHLQKAFDLDHRLTDVGQRLLATYEARGDDEHAVAILGVLVSNLEGARARLDATRRMHAPLLRLGRAHEAFEIAAQAVRESLGHQDVTPLLADLRVSAGAANAWQAYADLLEEVIALTDSPQAQVEQLVDLADCCLQHLNQPEAAKDALTRALAIDPDHHAALSRIEDLTLLQQDYVGLEQTLERRLAIAQEPAERRSLMMRLARLREDLTGNDEGAAATYRAVLSETPSEPEALAGLRRILERAGLFEELEDVLRQQSELSDDPRTRLAARRDRARVLWQKLDRDEDALQELDQILRIDPNHTDALSQVRALCDRPQSADLAVDLLVPFYRRTSRTRELAAVLKERLAIESRPEARAAVRMELVDLCEGVLDDPRAAFSFAVEAVKERPVTHAIERTLALAQSADEQRQAALALGQWVGILPEGSPVEDCALPDAATEARMAAAVGRLWAGPLDRPDLAIRAFEKAQPFTDENEGFLQTLLDCYRRVDDRKAALDTFDRLALVSGSPQDQQRVGQQKAAYAREVGLLDAAVETLQAVLAQGSEDPEVLAELEDVLGAAGRWPEMVEVLERREAVTRDASDRAELLYQMAVIERDQIRNPARAATLLERTLGSNPDHVEARIAAEALVLETPLPDRTPAHQQLGEVLEPILRAAGDRDRLIALLQARASTASSPAQSVAPLVELAVLHEEAGCDDAATNALMQAFLAVPEEEALLSRLLIAAARGSRLSEVLDRIEETSTGLPADIRVRNLLACADQRRQHDLDAERTLVLYEQVLEADPDALPVRAAMDDLLQTMGREAERVPLLEERVALAATVAEQAALRREIAAICERIGDPEGAADAWAAIVTHRDPAQPMDEETFDAALHAIALLEGSGRHRDVLDMKLAIGLGSPDATTARHYLLDAAREAREALGDAREASRIFDLLFERDPQDTEARERAKAMAREDNDQTRLVDLLRGEVAATADVDARNEALVELAEALSLVPSGRGEALAIAGTILDDAPGSDAACNILASLLDDGETGQPAALLLREAAMHKGDPARLKQALVVLLEHESDPVQRAGLRHSLAQVLDALGQATSSDEVQAQGLLDPLGASQGLIALVEHLTRRDRMSRLGGLVSETLAALPDPATRITVRMDAAERLQAANLPIDAEILLRANLGDDPNHVPSLSALAEIAARDPDDRARAEAYLSTALQADPKNIDANDAMARLLQERGDWLGVRNLVQREQDATRRGSKATNRTRHLQRTAIIADLNLPDLPDAVERAKQLLALHNADADDAALARRVHAEAEWPADLFEALIATYRRLGDHQECLNLYRFVAEQDLNEPTREEALLMALELAKGTGLQNEAFELLGLLVQSNPTSDRMDQLFDMARDAERQAKIRPILEASLAAAPGPDEAASIALALARMTRQDPALVDEAVTYYRLALTHTPDDQDARAEMIALLEQSERWADLALVFEEIGDLTDDPEARAEAYLRAADLAHHRLDDAPMAADLLRRAHAATPSNTTIPNRITAMFDELETLFDRTGQHASLAALYESEAARTTRVSDQIRLLRQAATVRKDRLADPTAAAALLARIEQDEGAWQDLRELYASVGRFEDVARLMQDRIRRDGEKADPELRLALAILLKTQLHDPDAAVEQAHLVLLQDPGHPEALGILADLRRDPLVGRHALDALADAHRLSGNTAALLDTLEDLTRRLLPEDDGALHAEAADLAARSNDRAGAIRHLGAALARSPSDEEFLERLTALAETPDARRSALDAVLTAARGAQWPEVETRLYLTAARLAADLPGSETMVEECARRVLTVDPSCSEALDLLEKAVLTTGDLDSLSDLLIRKLDSEIADEERVQVAARLADLLAQRGDLTGAARRLDEANDRVGADRGLLMRLLDLHQQRGDADGQIAALDRLASVMDPDEAADALVSAARLAIDAHKAPQEARIRLERALTLVPGQVEALDLLEGVYDSLNESNALFAMLQTRVTGDEPVAARVEAAMRAALVAEMQMSDHERALALLHQAAQIDPSALRVLDEIIRLTYQAEDWPGLALALQTKADRLDEDPAGRASLLTEALTIADERLHDHPLVAELASEILGIDPDHPVALLAQAGLLERDGNLCDAAAVLRRLTGVFVPEAQRTRALIGLARTLQGEELDRDEARAALEEALIAAPNNREALALLREQCLRDRDHVRLLSVLERELQLATDDEERAAICLQLAGVHRESGDEGRFLEWAQMALRHLPADIKALGLTVDFLLQSRDPSRAIPHLWTLVQHPQMRQHPDEARRYGEALGRLLEAAGDRDGAIRALEGCHEQDPRNVPCSLSLGRVLLAAQQDEKALKVFQPLLLGIDQMAPADQIALLLALATLNARAGNMPKAHQFAARVLAIDPDHAQALSLLSSSPS